MSRGPWAPPRPVREVAAKFLRDSESSGHLAHFGGAQGVIDASEAAYFLAFVFLALEWIFRPKSPDLVFYICAGANRGTVSPEDVTLPLSARSRAFLTTLAPGALVTIEAAGGVSEIVRAVDTPRHDPPWRRRAKADRWGT